MMEIRIRNAVPADEERIRSLFLEMMQTICQSDDVEGYPEGYLNRYWNGGKDRLYVAEDKEAIAFLSVEVHEESNLYIYLDDLSVTKAYRNQGIGSALIRKAESYAKESRIPAVLFHVEKTNKDAYRLYQRLGYEPYRDDGHRLLLKKDIRESDACATIKKTIIGGIVMKPNQFTGMLSVFRPPLCFELAGKEFFMDFDDGYDRTATFKDRKILSFGKIGEEKEFPYECLKIADKCYYVNFEDPTMEPRTAITLVLDLQTDLVTLAFGHVGTNPKIPGIPTIDYVFGAIRRADGTFSRTRHGYTTDLVGKSISWNYGYFDIAHVYATEHFYRVTFSPRGLARVYKGRPDMRSGESRTSYTEPGDTYEDYFTPIKIRDRIYLVGILETVKARVIGNGNSMLLLMNLDEMHDVGRSFGSNREGGTGNNTLGAFGVFVDATAVLAKKSSLFIR